MRKLGQRFTYANAASTLALVIAIGGGGTAVAMSVANNSVGSPEIINGSIKHKDLTNGKIGIVRGYAWNDIAAVAEDTPTTLTNSYKYNSAGGPITLTRSAVGAYSIHFEGLNIFPGNVQVTSYGNNGVYCQVGGWGGSSASVYCFNSAGAPTNSEWQIAMIE